MNEIAHQISCGKCTSQNYPINQALIINGLVFWFTEQEQTYIDHKFFLVASQVKKSIDTSYIITFVC